MAKTDTFMQFGYARGATDKLDGAPFNEEPPPSITGRAAQRSYKTGYKKGYSETSLPTSTGGGLSWSLSASASTDPGSSPPPQEAPPPPPDNNALQGFEADLPPQPQINLKRATSTMASLIQPKVQLQVAQRQAASPFGAPAPAPAMSSTLPASMPMQNELAAAPAASLVTPSAPAASIGEAMKAWLSENWMYVAAGTGAVIAVAIAYKIATSHKAPEAL